MKEEYRRWYTPYLSRDMEMLIFGHYGYPVILFPTSQGRYYENKDFHMIESVEWFIETGKIKIYCPDSIDGMSWYNKSIHPADRVNTHMGYERFIINEVFEMAMHDCRTSNVAVAGASFGGYHALNLALKYPDKIGYMFSMSGAFNMSSFLDGYYDENCYFSNPQDYLQNLSDPWYIDNLKWMEIILGAGEWDFCLEENKRISGLLWNKGVGNRFEEWRWAKHDWPIWRNRFPYYLSLINI